MSSTHWASSSAFSLLILPKRLPVLFVNGVWVSQSLYTHAHIVIPSSRRRLPLLPALALRRPPPSVGPPARQSID